MPCKTMEANSRSSQHPVTFSAWEHSGTVFLRLPCISVGAGTELRPMVCERTAQTSPVGPPCNLRGSCPACWKGAEHAGGTLSPQGLGRTTRLRRSMSQNHRIGRPPIKRPILLFVNKKYPFSILNHRGPRDVGYSIQLHHHMRDKHGCHSMIVRRVPPSVSHLQMKGECADTYRCGSWKREAEFRAQQLCWGGTCSLNKTPRCCKLTKP